MRVVIPKPTIRTLPDGAILVETARGAAHLCGLRRGAILYTCKGYLGTSFYEPMVAVAQREIDEAGELMMAVDGWALHSVETGFREAWTQWFVQHKRHFGMKLLVRTRLMEMAASLANLFTGVGVITTYSSIESWERAIGRDVRGFRRSPTPLSDG